MVLVGGDGKVRGQVIGGHWHETAGGQQQHTRTRDTLMDEQFKKKKFLVEKYLGLKLDNKLVNGP